MLQTPQMHIASEYSAPRFRRPDSVQVKIGAARQADRSLEAAHEQTAAPIAKTQGPPKTGAAGHDETAARPKARL